MSKTDISKILERQILTCSGLQVREAGEGQQSRTIEGYAILFNTPSAPLWRDEDGEIREVIAPEAVTREFLDGCDIKMTMFHDRQLILARSKNGEGTLNYVVDENGVKFTFDAPHTADGDKALELVKRGDIAGCSFAFTARYFDESCVSHEVVRENGYSIETYTVRSMTGIYDFTLAADPAYPDTSVEARELAQALKTPAVVETPTTGEPKDNRYREQAVAMRKAARKFKF